MNDPSSKLPVLLFGLLLALCATVCVAFLLGEIPVEEVSTPGGREQRTYLGHGVTHPVFPSMNHGGPFPATGHPGFTAVGLPASLRRFGALHCFDSVSNSRLPSEIQDKNPTGEMWRYIDLRWTTEDI